MVWDGRMVAAQAESRAEHSTAQHNTAEQSTAHQSAASRGAKRGKGQAAALRLCLLAVPRRHALLNSRTQPTAGLCPARLLLHQRCANPQKHTHAEPGGQPA